MKIEPFNNFPAEYDEWFDKEGQIYELELKAIKDLIPKVGKGLEVGSGTGRFSIPTGIKIGIEPSHPMGKISAGKGLSIILGIAESLPLRSESFDFILYNTVICFLDSLRLSFLESFRVLRPGGSVVVGFIDRESYLGNIYNREKDKSKFFKDAIFCSVPELSKILTESGYESLEYGQTLIFDINNGSLSDKISSGYGEGSYVVIKGYKKQRGEKMDKIRICIGSNDGESIARSHMGDTKQFLIFDILKNSEMDTVDTRVNVAIDLDHSASNKMQEILKIVGDADILVAWQKSPNFTNIAKKTKYQPVVVKAEKINDVLNILKNSFVELKELADKRKEGDFSPEIPEFKLL